LLYSSEPVCFPCSIHALFGFCPFARVRKRRCPAVLGINVVRARLAAALDGCSWGDSRGESGCEFFANLLESGLDQDHCARAVCFVGESPTGFLRRFRPKGDASRGQA
jgi:hypothetical protein